ELLAQLAEAGLRRHLRHRGRLRVRDDDVRTEPLAHPHESVHGVVGAAQHQVRHARPLVGDRTDRGDQGVVVGVDAGHDPQVDDGAVRDRAGRHASEHDRAHAVGLVEGPRGAVGADVAADDDRSEQVVVRHGPRLPSARGAPRTGAPPVAASRSPRHGGGPARRGTCRASHRPAYAVRVDSVKQPPRPHGDGDDTGGIGVPPDFEAALLSLRGHRLRPELHLEEVPPPTRIAPYALALTGEVNRTREPEDLLGSGRFVVLYDPEGQEAWNGTFRVIVMARARMEPEVAQDPLLGEVGWAWLT